MNSSLDGTKSTTGCEIAYLKTFLSAEVLPPISHWSPISLLQSEWFNVIFCGHESFSCALMFKSNQKPNEAYRCTGTELYSMCCAKIYRFRPSCAQLLFRKGWAKSNIWPYVSLLEPFQNHSNVNNNL